MSTKLYEGLIVRNIKTVADLVGFIDKVREIWDEERLIKQRELFTQDVLSFLVQNSNSNVLISEMWAEVLIGVNREHNINRYRLGEVFLFPLGESDDMLAYVTGSTGLDVYNRIINLGLAEEYGYWNNTDQPSNITGAEWEKRREDWEVVKFSLDEAKIIARENEYENSIFSQFLKPENEEDKPAAILNKITKKLREQTIRVAVFKELQKKEGYDVGRSFFESIEYAKLIDVEVTKIINPIGRDVAFSDKVPVCEIDFERFLVEYDIVSKKLTEERD